MSARARFDRVLRVRAILAREAAAAAAHARAAEERERAMMDRLGALAAGYGPTSGSVAQLRRAAGFAGAVADARRTTTTSQCQASERAEAAEAVRREAEADRLRAEKLRDAAALAERRAAAKAATVRTQIGTLPALLRANASDGEAAQELHR